MIRIAGVFEVGERPAGDIGPMLATMQRFHIGAATAWREGGVAVGQVRLSHGDPKGEHRVPVVRDAEAGTSIVADARIDNRDELRRDLRENGIEVPLADGDAGLILAAYGKYGDECCGHLIGDFAFTIFDSRARRMFCARDAFGVRQFYYHHAAGHLFAFASDCPTLVAYAHVPCRIDEGRIGEYMLGMEGVDHTGTFFEEVVRLPPGFSLVVTSTDCTTQRWYFPKARCDVGDPDEYERVFRELLTQAVACRVGDGHRVGSMLSGGLDSSAVAAIAAGLPRVDGNLLPVFSLVSARNPDCPETRAIHSMLRTGLFDSHQSPCDAPGDLDAELTDAMWNVDDPFDASLSAPLAAYSLARRAGVDAVLDGIDADTLLGKGDLIAGCIRGGRWTTALTLLQQDAAMLNRGHGWATVRALRTALVPELLRRAARKLISPFRYWQRRRQSLVAARFAKSVNLKRRHEIYACVTIPGLAGDAIPARVRVLLEPHLSAALGRYNRVAFSQSVEPLHPFLDQRLVEFCAGVPDEEFFQGGFRKALMRRSLAGILPRDVAWRPDKHHLGWQQQLRLRLLSIQRIVGASKDITCLKRYVDARRLQHMLAESRLTGQEAAMDDDLVTASLVVSFISAANRCDPAPNQSGVCSEQERKV